DLPRIPPHQHLAEVEDHGIDLCHGPTPPHLAGRAGGDGPVLLRPIGPDRPGCAGCRAPYGPSAMLVGASARGWGPPAAHLVGGSAHGPAAARHGPDRAGP